MTYNTHAINDCLTSERDARSERFRRAVVGHGEPYAEPRAVAPVHMPYSHWWLKDFTGHTSDNCANWCDSPVSRDLDNNTIALLRQWFYLRHHVKRTGPAGWCCDFVGRDRWWQRVTPEVVAEILPGVRAVASIYAALYADHEQFATCWVMSRFLHANLPALEAIFIPILEVE